MMTIVVSWSFQTANPLTTIPLTTTIVHPNSTSPHLVSRCGLTTGQWIRLSSSQQHEAYPGPLIASSHILHIHITFKHNLRSFHLCFQQPCRHRYRPAEESCIRIAPSRVRSKLQWWKFCTAILNMQFAMSCWGWK